MRTNDPLHHLIRSLGRRSPRAGIVSGAAAPLSSLAGVAGTTPAAGGGSPTDAIAQNTAQVAQLRAILQSQIDATAENTRALAGTAGAHTAAASGPTAGSVAGTIAGIVTGGFSLNPIISGLMKLFSGSPRQTPLPLSPYVPPPPIAVSAGISGGRLTGVDYGQNGLPRSAAKAPATQVNVNISAMDSRSFLDRSDDIAQAVRRAMLESSTLNDVVAEI